MSYKDNALDKAKHKDIEKHIILRSRDQDASPYVKSVRRFGDKKTKEIFKRAHVKTKY